MSDRAIGLVSAFALAASEENARGHLVITAPTGGSAGVMPAIVYALTQSDRAVPMDKIREGLLAGLAVGYLCKHNATLAAAEGGCQAEIGVASAMAAALITQVLNQPPRVIENAAESYFRPSGIPRSVTSSRWQTTGACRGLPARWKPTDSANRPPCWR